MEEKVEREVVMGLLRRPLLITLAPSMSSGDFSELRKLEYPLEPEGVWLFLKSRPWWALFGAVISSTWRCCCCWGLAEEPEVVGPRRCGMYCWVGGDSGDVWKA